MSNDANLAKYCSSSISDVNVALMACDVTLLMLTYYKTLGSIWVKLFPVNKHECPTLQFC
jgi:hypothetical protein